MWLRSFLKSVKSRPPVAAFRRSPPRPRSPQLRVEALDDRCLPSTFTVTNLLDSGAGSLRAAVNAANANPGADDIVFATTGTIALTGGQLDLTDSLTINGPGESALTVSGEGVSRVFAITGAPTVVIANLAVANGRTYDSPGGGISMVGGAVTLNYVTVSGNVANSTPNYVTYGHGLGGGLYVEGGTLTLNQCDVFWNSALGAPGGYDYYWNNFYPSGDGRGGGLYVASGTVYIDQCTISGNYARAGDGGISYGEFTSAGYSGGYADGGGLSIGGGLVHLNQSTVSGNGAYGGAGGGGWDVTYGADGGSATGGGISNRGGTLEVRQSTISENEAAGGPGGLGYWNSGLNGVGVGGGLYLAGANPPRADLDTYTVSNTINNFADTDPNISGPYTSNGGTFNPRLTISDVSTLEGNIGTQAVTFTVSVSAASNQPITVAYATADGTATAGSDYQFASGTLTIPAGQTTGTITVLVNGDRLAEPNETFSVNLTNPNNATIADGQGAGTILDDEPRISISDVTRTEGNSGLTAFAFTVSLSVAYDVPVTVDYATANSTATAGSDYQAASGTLTIPAGQTSGTIIVMVNGERLAEPNKTFLVNLSNLNYGTVADSQSVGTIVDDEPHISISDATKREGRKNTTLFTFTVTLSAAYDEPVTVSYRTADGTATAADGDYVAQTGTITFLPGETSKTITIVVNGDTKKETDESFSLYLFDNSSNSLFTKSRGLGTILNDD